MANDIALVRGIPLEEEPGLGALTLPGFLREVVTRYGPREALVMRRPDGTAERWSYDELWDRTVAVARALIACGLDNRAEALEYALQFGRGIDAAVADRFVAMYVNDLTEDYGDEGRTAVSELLRRGEAIGAFPERVAVDWVK